MSRTKRICPRRYKEVADGKLWHKCKCEWCRNVDKQKANERWEEAQITLYLHGSSKENTEDYI